MCRRSCSLIIGGAPAEYRATAAGTICGHPGDLGGCSARYHDPRCDSAAAQTAGLDYSGSVSVRAFRVAEIRRELHL
jgi:hypothetical protein